MFSAPVRFRLAALPLFALASVSAAAHFLAVLPSSDSVTPEGPKPIAFRIVFTHPMAGGPAMQMDTPKHFGVLVQGKRQDLLKTLIQAPVNGKTAYRAEYVVKEPGAHVFYFEPAPYWEPAEQKMIIHYTKVVVDGLGLWEGWDALAGLPVEIEPLTRPFGLWTGNVFQGRVLRNGTPAPAAEIEVEYWNEGGAVRPPTPAHETQVIKADINGVFSYAMPRAGWWGFAALLEGDAPMPNPEGKPVEVELGGLMWVKAVDMK
jgi:cobalt/nickel transport protein